MNDIIEEAEKFIEIFNNYNLTDMDKANTYNSNKICKNDKKQLENKMKEKLHTRKDNRLNIIISEYEIIKMHENIGDKILELYSNKYNYINSRGIFVYPKNGYCEWHTNYNRPGKRIYLVWAKEDNKSYFRYFDREKNEIITKYEKKGWQINDFEIFEEPDKQFWHCVGSDTTRVSLGFRLS